MPTPSNDPMSNVPDTLDFAIEDLERLLEALDLGTHARPISPAQVFEECLAEIKELRAKLEQDIRFE